MSEGTILFYVTELRTWLQTLQGSVLCCHMMAAYTGNLALYLQLPAISISGTFLSMSKYVLFKLVSPEIKMSHISDISDYHVGLIN